MSKSKKNVVDPNDIINLYGADTARWFMLSDSPPERDLQWTETGISASYKFVNKLYSLLKNIKITKIIIQMTPKQLRVLELLLMNLRKYESFQFNKSVAKIYEYVNVLNGALVEINYQKGILVVSKKIIYDIAAICSPYK